MTEVAELARRAVLDHLLVLAQWSEAGDLMVLRGSMPMVGWYLGRARPPGDLDWLVLDHHEPGWDNWTTRYGSIHDLAVDLAEDRPSHEPDYDPSLDTEFDPDDVPRPAFFRAENRRRWEQMTGFSPPPWGIADQDDWDEEPEPPHQPLLAVVRKFPVVAGPTGDITLDPDRATTNTLWSYSCPGLRLTIPWHAPGLPEATASCDFAQVYDDDNLVGELTRTTIPRGDGGSPATVTTVDRGLSLAWKLQWLHADNHPEDRHWIHEDEDETPRVSLGKDLYDAVLLAEDPATDLSLARLEQVFEPAAERIADGPPAIDTWIGAWRVDWARFQASHPEVTGSASEWLERLANALSQRWWPE